VLRGYPKDKGLKPYGEEEELSARQQTGDSLRKGRDWKVRESIATPVFWLMYSMYFFGFTTFLVIVIHLFNFAIDSGIPPIIASGAPAFIGVGSIIGRLTISGLFTKVLENRKVLFLCFLIQGSSLFIILGLKEVWAFYLFGTIFGFFYSGWVPIFPTLLGNFFGLRSIGAIYGFFGTSFCVAAVIGPPAAGYIHDAIGTYSYAFALCILFCYVAAISSFLIRPPSREAKSEGLVARGL
jgi:MFS family permease